MSASTRITCSNGTECCYNNHGEANEHPFTGHPRQRIGENVPAFWVEVTDADDDNSFVEDNPLGSAVCLFCKNRARKESDGAHQFISLAKNGWRNEQAAAKPAPVKKTARKTAKNANTGDSGTKPRRRKAGTVTLAEAAGVA